MVMRYLKANIKYKNMLSESLMFNKGTKRGNGLSATLFIAALKDIDPVSYTHLDVYKRQFVSRGVLLAVPTKKLFRLLNLFVYKGDL